MFHLDLTLDFDTVNSGAFTRQHQNIGDEFEASIVAATTDTKFATRCRFNGNYTNTKPDGGFAHRILESRANAMIFNSVGTK